MALTIYGFTNFKKRINSTKQPSISNAITYNNVFLKAPTSRENPTFIITPVNYNLNYIKWDDHYYFVTDIVVGNKDIMEVSCHQDVLATYKTDIGNLSAYVEYSGSNNNIWIPDKRLTVSDDVITKTESSAEIFGNTGTVILTTAGKDLPPSQGVAAQVGFTNIYGLTLSNAKQLANYLYDTDIKSDLERFFTSPFDAIVSAMYVPISLSTTGTTVFVGKHNTNIEAGGLQQSVLTAYSQGYDVDIPWRYNDWRDFAPYSVMTMYLPFYGVVQLDQSKLKGQSSISITRNVDASTGELNYMATAGSWKANYKCDVGVPLAIAQISTNKVKGITEGGVGVVGAGIGIAAATSTVGKVAAVVGGVTAVGAGAVEFFQEDASSKGGNGGFASLRHILAAGQDTSKRKISITLYSHKFGVSDPANINSVQGRPLFEKKTINTLSGYVQCAGASVNISGTDGDKQEVNQYLNSGFYYE